MKVFVYGTLMQGFGNHRVMEEAQGKFITKAFIRDKDIFFVSLGSFPAVIDGKGIVFGEIYEIPDEKIKTWRGDLYPIKVLDSLEGYNSKTRNGMYLRKRAVAVTPKGEKIWVSYYYWNGEVNAQMKIKHGDWGKAVKKFRTW